MIASPGKYYVYAVIDTAESPATLLAIRLTRQDARGAMNERLPIDDTEPQLRVRRAKLTLFET